MGLIHMRNIHILLVFTVTIILLETNGCKAAFPVKSNFSYKCKGSLNECRIVEALDSELELELDMVMNSNVVRILQRGNTPVTSNTGNRNRPVQQTCPSPQYASCLATGGRANCRGTYCRG
ncbi:hypothetical protein Goari_016016 [Gossypium aridum]|uniref:Uncharacterized protein n=2 Tax=Gossypium TaxID=3633 RepID=A0A0D2PIJ4_GOSRA|nr:hypothetical protein B456_001G091800 [Gossypium raimondii]MBA0674416.1 hypothetical protein [Gossypium aridum]